MRRLMLTVVIAATAIAGVLGTATATHLSSEELLLLRLTNDARGTSGLAHLALQRDLVSSARMQSREMLSAGDIFHSPDLADRVPGLWSAAGENVGRGYDIRDIQTAFMASPTHRANVLDPEYSQVGIGTVVRESDGRIFVTVLFATRTETEPMPVSEAGRLAREPVSAAFSSAIRHAEEPTTAPPATEMGAGTRGIGGAVAVLVELVAMDSALARPDRSYIPVA